MIPCVVWMVISAKNQPSKKYDKSMLFLAQYVGSLAACEAERGTDHWKPCSTLGRIQWSYCLLYHFCW